MKKIFAILALTLLLVPGFVMAQPPGCSWDGDPAMRYGWGQYDGLPYNQPGWDYNTLYPGASITYTLAPYNCNPATYTPGTCPLADTICFHAVSFQGWVLGTDPAMDTPMILSPGYVWYQDITITAPCTAVPGDKDTIVASAVYANNAIVCAPECGDCADPNVRISTGVPYYQSDTLVITVVAAPPALGVFQDTLTLVDRGQTQAYVPFSVCNQDDCAPSTHYYYNVTSVGVPLRIPPINQTGDVWIDGGACQDVYGVIDAGLALECDYDTLTIIVWTDPPVAYDTCVQVIHIVEPEDVPLFTAPVVTILVLALILAAAVFMRRRAVSNA